jgi:hypothetical protein
MSSHTPPRLPELPTEVVENISEFLGDDELATWCALRLTCRALEAKVAYAFGKRFFHTIKFSLHPYSLYTLVDISRRPEFAIHVRTLAFGTENKILFDPIHDPQVVNAGRRGRALPRHEASQIEIFDIDVLFKYRRNYDACLIRKAIDSFSNLKLVLIGDELELNDRIIRPSWGRFYTVESVSGFCNSRHCRKTDRSRLHWTFDTVSCALQLAKRSDICFGASIPGVQSSDWPRDYGMWPGATGLRYGNEEVRRGFRMTHLQLNLAATKSHSGRHPLLNLYTGNHIETLVVVYDDQSCALHRYLSDFPPGMTNLRSITLKKGKYSAQTLIGCFQTHRSLENISLVRCTLGDSS